MGRHRRRQGPGRLQQRPLRRPGQRGSQLAHLESTRRRSSPPELIATTISKAVTTRRPKTRYAAGYGARPMIVLHGPLPDRTFDAFIRRATSVPST
jgi:hypothetical protein